ncbi:hypothetical protein SAMN02745121_03207 [Nannocystis exedens]|uniref:Uncharacterized protein n=1 Tax=Nannocystis exedens TaxID=54 RepID=A0A1I1Y6S6_9BACT|nr:hypothetical protein [Nannocystis exedens]PCC71855.1 hypothetical protein NAEX_04934 [Nannocystis exedens]SFE15281.1 hypothetical protein SAMN02745121_03207 [Nannocystis exedens]
MRDEPVTTRELVAAYRDRERPSDAARERMARALMAAAAARSATVIPLRPPRRRRRAIAGGWLALAAALALVAASSYWLVSARQQQGTGPADMLMDSHDHEPAQRTVAPKPIEARSEPPAGHATAVEGPTATMPIVDAASAPEPSAALPIAGAAATSEPKAPAVATAESPPVVEPAPPVAEPAPRRPARPQPRQVAAEPPRSGEAAGDPVLEELMLIQQIKDALDADRPASALAAIDAHAQKFARGSLTEEREALRVVALCNAGEVARGERAQQAFMRTYPRSAYRERVRAACPVAAAATMD